MNKMIIFLVFSVMLVSGCTDEGGASGGSSVSGNKETEILAEDILSLNAFEIIPSETLTPDKSFILRLEAENIGNNAVTLKVDDSGSYDGDNVLYDYCSDISEGKVDYCEGGVKYTYIKGDRFFIPKGVKHSAKVYTEYASIVFFNKKDRYKEK